MADMSKYFKKYQSALLAQQLEPHAQELGITVRELATNLAKIASEKSGDREQAHKWASVAIFEARREQGLMK